MSKRKDARPAYAAYPATRYIEVGYKVGWRYYDNRADAEECAEAARHNAAIQAGLGYDFGYCSPGSITKMVEGRYAGYYEVCIP